MSVSGPQDRIGIDGGSVAGMNLQVKVSRPTPGVSGIPHVANHPPRGYPHATPDAASNVIQMSKVVSDPIVAVQPYRGPPRPRLCLTVATIPSTVATTRVPLGAKISVPCLL